MLNFIINFTRVILFVIISVSSHVSIAMDGSDSETDSSLKRKRTFSSEEGKTDDSDFDTSKKHLPPWPVSLGFLPTHIRAVLQLFSLFLPDFPHIFSRNIPVPVQHNHCHI